MRGLRLLPEPEQPERDGRQVVAWVGQVEFAHLVRLSDRQIRNLIQSGLPWDPDQGVPLPHGLLWFVSYLERVGRSEVVVRLPMDVCFAEHQARVARADAEDEGRLLTRPRAGR